MSNRKCILVPRFADADNFNAQNQNAKSMLSRFRDGRVRWSMVHYDAPEPALAHSPNLSLTKLLPRHLWRPHLAAWYQKPADAIFYPGIESVDECGLALRRKLHRTVRLISILEGLAGTREREEQFSAWAGHPVFCQRIDERAQQRLDYVFGISDYIFAISPFIAKMGRRLYGDKISVLMLGVEGDVFHSTSRNRRPRPLVVSVGAVRKHKRPEFFIDLAKRFPEADFVWFGEGDLRHSLSSEASRLGLANLNYAGPRSPQELAATLRSAQLFAMPSYGEGVPKVTQEAAASGLPMVVYGFYEAPTVIDGRNGFVAWTDVEFADRVGTLISDPKLAEAMGEQSANMAKDWTWELMAPQWEREVIAQCV